MAKVHGKPERRTFLRALGGLAIGGIGAAGARPAAAVTPVDQRDYRNVLDQGCGATAYHKQLLDEAAAKLGVSLTDEQRAAAMASVVCPTCGCPLVQALAAAPAGQDSGF